MDHDDRRLLARFEGMRPPAPAWFTAAVQQRPDVRRTTVEGAGIEYLVWGEPGAPGVLLVHGGRAHAGWWAHIAPFLASERRVAALSLSGMGGSDWRESYSIAQYAREMQAVTDAAGLDAAGPPIVVSHSFGCAPTVAAVADPADWTAGVVLIDASVDMKPGDTPPRTSRSYRPFATLADALARYRLIPSQPCENLYIADMIARESLRESADGLRWSFDPTLYERCTFIDSRAAARAAKRPIAFIRGERSAIVPPEKLTELRRDLPAGTQFVNIPDAGHHVMVDQPLALVTALRALFVGWPDPA